MERGAWGLLGLARQPESPKKMPESSKPQQAVALRMALLLLLAVGYVAAASRATTSSPTVNLEARRQASSAAASYRARTFRLKIPQLRSVLAKAQEDGKMEDDATPPAAQTSVAIGEFAGYKWCVPRAS